jgi:hypothetical protein
MVARIYRPAPTAMQSGKANAQHWILEFENAASRRIEPMMGWTSSDDTSTQVRMRFETREEAVAFAQREGIEYRLVEPRETRRVIKAYADNFAAGRRRPWTH